MNTPILLLVFNRPDFLNILLKQLELVRPKIIYVSCDGPRNEHDKKKIDEIKELISNISWKPTVNTFFREENLMTYKAIPSALDWFFSQVEEGIILEDDCIPDVTFFKFCEENLKKYRYDERILTISGNNIQMKAYGEASYYFSHVPHIWGWATWKRSWNLFDFEMNHFPTFEKNNELERYFDDIKVRKRLLTIFRRAFNGKNIWDFKLTFMHFINNGYSIIPNSNLVTNIGFDERATHPIIADDPIANLQLRPIEIITHPISIVDYYESYNHLGKTIFKPHSKKDYLIKSFLYIRKWIYQKLNNFF